MFSLNFLKKSGPESQPNRCHFQHQNGRRCRLPVADESTEFCGTHRDMLAQAKTHEDHQADLASIYAEVMGPIKSLDSAVAINHVLSNLFRLTLQGRIPQRKAATLTTQLRAMLRTVEAARDEITTAKLFPHNHRALLALLATLSDAPASVISSESDQGFARDLDVMRTSQASNGTNLRPETRDSVVAVASTPPGSGETDNLEEPDKPSNAINHETVAPNSSSASFTAPIPTSAPTNPAAVILRASDQGCRKDLNVETQDAVLDPDEPAASITSTSPQTQSINSTSHSSDGVCWIGPKPDQIDWARVEEEKREYERYLRQAYPPTLNGYHHVPPDKIPLYMRRRK